jgi:hypothetical protein
MAKVRSYQGTRTAVLVTVLIGGACGKVGPSHESELSDKAGAAGSEGFAGETLAGTGGLAAARDFGCQFSAHLIEEWLWGRPYDRERGCVDTSHFVAPDWCIVPPGHGSGLVGFQCLRRLSDGAEFWTYAPGELAFDSEGWEPCSDLFPDAPLPRP